MSKLDIIRAWKDPDYRLSLTDSDRAKLPAHPAGLIELSDVDLGAVLGGDDPRDTPLGICDQATPGSPCVISVDACVRTPVPPKCPTS
jgi:mersacidin/lichenicidin family type 2 lantibiotic